MENSATAYNAYLITKDISEQDSSLTGPKTESIKEEDIYKILDFKLDNHRQRNSSGEPYRSIRFGRLWIKLDATQHASNQIFYENMRNETPVSFTRVYGNIQEIKNDKSLTIAKQLKKNEDSMIYDLYIVKIEELYDKDSSEQVQLNIEFLCVDNNVRHDKDIIPVISKN